MAATESELKAYRSREFMRNGLGSYSPIEAVSRRRLFPRSRSTLREEADQAVHVCGTILERESIAEFGQAIGLFDPMSVTSKNEIRFLATNARSVKAFHWTEQFWVLLDSLLQENVGAASQSKVHLMDPSACRSILQSVILSLESLIEGPVLDFLRFVRSGTSDMRTAALDPERIFHYMTHPKRGLNSSREGDANAICAGALRFLDFISAMNNVFSMEEDPPGTATSARLRERKSLLNEMRGIYSWRIQGGMAARARYYGAMKAALRMAESEFRNDSRSGMILEFRSAFREIEEMTSVVIDFGPVPADVANETFDDFEDDRTESGFGLEGVGTLETLEEIDPLLQKDLLDRLEDDDDIEDLGDQTDRKS